MAGEVINTNRHWFESTGLYFKTTMKSYTKPIMTSYLPMAGHL